MHTREQSHSRGSDRTRTEDTNMKARKPACRDIVSGKESKTKMLEWSKSAPGEFVCGQRAFFRAGCFLRALDGGDRRHWIVQGLAMNRLILKILHPSR